MVSLYSGNGVKESEQCGLHKSCGSGNCVNVFSFLSMDPKVYDSQIKEVKKQMNVGSINANILTLFVGLVGIGCSSEYQRYQKLLLDEILVIALVLIHFMFFCLVGIGGGYLLRKFPFVQKQKTLSKISAPTFQ